VLPWLAWEMQVGNFNSNWQTPVQRQSIASSARIHRQKGTLASAQAALDSAGYRYARIELSHGNYQRDGSRKHDGFDLHGANNPYRYRVKVSAVISIAQANEIRALLAETLPVRCQLHSFDIVNARLLHNGAIRRDGSYTRGVIYG
jgi:P2-related tail formation protein